MHAIEARGGSLPTCLPTYLPIYPPTYLPIPIHLPADGVDEDFTEIRHPWLHLPPDSPLRWHLRQRGHLFGRKMWQMTRDKAYPSRRVELRKVIRLFSLIQKERRAERYRFLWRQCLRGMINNNVYSPWRNAITELLLQPRKSWLNNNAPRKRTTCLHLLYITILFTWSLYRD